MGSCLGKPKHQSSSSTSRGEGRVLGPAPAATTRPTKPTPPPAPQTRGPGRTLATTNSQHQQPADARQAAALAASQRAHQERSGSGQLGAKLAQEKSKKRSELLAKDPNNTNNNEPLIYD